MVFVNGSDSFVYSLIEFMKRVQLAFPLGKAVERSVKQIIGCNGGLIFEMGGNLSPQPDYGVPRLKARFG